MPMPLLKRRLSHYLWRFNAYVFALAGVIAILAGTLVLYKVGKSIFRDRHVSGLARASNNAAPGSRGAKSSVLLNVGNFQAIAGTVFLRAPIFTRDRRSTSSYSKIATGTRNYFYYNTNNGSSHRLLPGSKGLILNDYTLRPATTGSRSQHPKATLFRVVESDHNGDGLLSQTDNAALLLTRPDGRNILRLADNVDDVLGHHIISDKELVVIIRIVTPQGGKTVKAIHISLGDFKVLREQLITN